MSVTDHVSRILVALAGLAMLGIGNADAQFWDKLTNPKLNVQVKHAPGLGLQVKRIAFGPTKGERVDQFLDAIVEDFVTNGIEVIEREQLQTLLAEHNFGTSNYVDRESVAQLGRILGPTALIFVNLQRLATQQDRTYEDRRDSRGNVWRTWHSRTRAFLKASVRTVDLATGRVFQAATIEVSPVRVNTSDQGCCAEHPAAWDVQDLALKQAAYDVHKLFLPWSEARELYFFDDKDCDLKLAYTFLKAGDLASAHEQSAKNLEACRTSPKGKDKTLAHTIYNLGMTHLLQDEYDKALELFAEAQRTKQMDITAQTLTEAQRAKVLAAERQRVEERSVVEAAAESSTRATTAGPGAGPVREGEPRQDSVKTAAVEERLRKLEELYRKKLITKVEYDKKRAEILKEM
jgi:tetratricopeptide (TPR) repeat protein